MRVSLCDYFWPSWTEVVQQATWCRMEALQRMRKSTPDTTHHFPRIKAPIGHLMVTKMSYCSSSNILIRAVPTVGQLSATSRGVQIHASAEENIKPGRSCFLLRILWNNDNGRSQSSTRTTAVNPARPIVRSRRKMRSMWAMKAYRIIRPLCWIRRSSTAIVAKRFVVSLT